MQKTYKLTEEIRTELFRLQDLEYRKLQIRTIPSLDPESIIGVRTPTLRAYAKVLRKHPDVMDFLQDLPHQYFDENQIHAFIISEIKSYDACIREVNRFLPYVDNWATCDQMSPKVFSKYREELLPEIRKWTGSDHTYTIRFGIGMLMEHFLKEAFDPAYPEMVAAVRSEEYYINMMIAWYFATALAFQYEEVLPYLEEQRLDAWTHNKTIQKAIESYRITDEQKAYLRTLKISTKAGQEPQKNQIAVKTPDTRLGKTQKDGLAKTQKDGPGKTQKDGPAKTHEGGLAEPLEDGQTETYEARSGKTQKNGKTGTGSGTGRPMKVIHVAAAIIREKGRIFATQRGYGDWKDYWEFPGGKIEPGETPEEALAREIQEELDTAILVGDKFITVEYDYPDFHLHMECFLAEVLAGSLILKEHEAARWLGTDELEEVNWLPADREIIQRLQKEEQHGEASDG